MTAPTSVAVVGGGVVGLCTAWFLDRAGVDVTVVEARRVGSGASYCNAGWVVPSLAAPMAAPGVAREALRSLPRAEGAFWLAPRLDPGLATWLWRFWRAGTQTRHHAGLVAVARLASRTFELFDKLAAEGVAMEMHADGLLYCALTESAAHAGAEHFRTVPGYAAKVGDPVTGRALRELEPALSDAVAAGVLISGERRVEPDGLMAGLASALRERGVEILEGAEVTSLQASRGAVTAVRTTAGTVAADAVVLAAGAWTTLLARELDLRLPMQAAKGYSVIAELPQTPRRSLYLAEARAGVAPYDGYVRLAGTMELSGLNTRLDRRRLDAFVRSSRRYLAGWDGAAVRDASTGMRPVTADSLPVIGAAPGWRNVFFATGHAMLGLTLGPPTGEALAEGIVNGRMPEVLRPFDPARFT